MLTVHLRVNDAATGRPTPVRLRITGPDGTYYAPFGRLFDFARGVNEDVGGNLTTPAGKFAYIDGGCEVRLPAGAPLRVQAIKGPEYEWLDREVVLGPGQMALRFEVRRWSDLRADGWFPGDTRAHFLTPHAALLEAGAEDLAVVNLLVRDRPMLASDGNTYPTLANMTAFSGQAPAVEAGGRLVVVNTLNAHPVLGRVGLLNCHRPVFPLTFGGDEPDDWSVCDWCDQCHRKNGLNVWADPFRTHTEPPGGEALVALVLGKIDAMEFDARRRDQPFLPWYYRCLDAGFPVALAGGSGKDSNRTATGAVRTYARLPGGESFSYRAWVEAVRGGRTFVTNGPILRFSVDGHGPGSRIDLPGSVRPVVVRASAEGVTPFERLEVVAGGQVIATAEAAITVGRSAAALEFEYTPAAGSGWIAARCVGSSFMSYLAPPRSPFAHTSPVYVNVAGRPLPRNESTLRPLRLAVEQTRDWVEQHGRFAEEKRKRHLLDLCDAALARLTTSETPTA